MRTILLCVVLVFALANAQTTCSSSSPCPTGFWCNQTTCGDSGVCAPIPSSMKPSGGTTTSLACPLPPVAFGSVPSVCGCNGKKYYTECLANDAGTAVDRTGAACKVAEITCSSNADCTSSSVLSKSYCKMAGCTGKGVCTPKPDACPTYATIPPLCGCDGKKYNNDCEAAASGTNIDSTCNDSSVPTEPVYCNACPGKEVACPKDSECCSICGGAGTCSAPGTTCPPTVVACLRYPCDVILPPPPPSDECNCSGQEVPKCPNLGDTLLSTACMPVPVYSSTDSAKLTVASKCSLVPICTPPKICTISGCGVCTEAALPIKQLPTSTTQSGTTTPTASTTPLATFAEAMVACSSSTTLSSIQRLCQPLRECRYNSATSSCEFTKASESIYAKCIVPTPVPVDPPVCKGITNPCGCDFTLCKYIKGEVSVKPAGGADSSVAQVISIGQCLPIDVADKAVEALAPTASLSGAVSATATAASSSTTASVTATIAPITIRPPICTDKLLSELQTSVSDSVNPVAKKILSQGVDTATVTSQLAALLKDKAEFANVITRILTFGVPDVNAKGWKLPAIIEVTSSTPLTSTQTTALCKDFKGAVAVTLGFASTDAKFDSCEVKTVVSSSSSAKRGILEGASSAQYAMTVGMNEEATASSASSFSPVIAVVMFVVLAIFNRF